MLQHGVIHSWNICRIVMNIVIYVVIVCNPYTRTHLPRVLIGCPINTINPMSCECGPWYARDEKGCIVLRCNSCDGVCINARMVLNVFLWCLKEHISKIAFARLYMQQFLLFLHSWELQIIQYRLHLRLWFFCFLLLVRLDFFYSAISLAWIHFSANAHNHIDVCWCMCACMHDFWQIMTVCLADHSYFCPHAAVVILKSKL